MKMMRKMVIMFIVCAVSLCLCSFTCWSEEASVPDDGVWYCEDLLVAIDFEQWRNGETYSCAIRYTDSDKLDYEIVTANVNMNSSYMYIQQLNPEIDNIAQGECEYSDGTFKIFDDKKTYVFERTSYNSINEIKQKYDIQ